MFSNLTKLMIDKSTPLADLEARFAGSGEHLAVIHNDIATLIALIHNSPHRRTSRTMLSPLALGVLLQREDAVTALIDHNAANVNELVFYNTIDVSIGVRHVVLCAAHVSSVQIVRLLINAPGVDFSNANGGETVCHAAALSDDPSVLAWLIANGHEFDLPDLGQERPSHVAARNLNADMIRTLLQARCDVNALDSRGSSLAHAAASNLNDAVLAELIAAGITTLGHVNQAGIASIHIAAHNDNEKVVAMFIAAGVDVNVEGPDKETAALLACQNYNGRILDTLIAAGGQLRGTKFSPCQAAARNHNDYVMSRLIGLGFDVNDSGSSGDAPLSIAACLGTDVVVQMLIDAGANVNVVSRGRTVCFEASFNERAGVMEALLEAGADFRAGGDPTAVFSNAVEFNNLNVVMALCNAGFDIATECGVNSITILRSACNHLCRPSLLRFLLQKGANFRGVDSLGESVCRGARTEALVELFAVGANLSQVNAFGKAPSEFASVDSLLTFVAAGADVDEFVRHTAARFVRGSGERALMVAAGAVDGDVLAQELDAACIQIAQRQFLLLRARAFQVCVGLAAADLPALQTSEILAHVFAPRECIVPFHRLWAIATTVKHSRRQQQQQQQR